MLQGIGSAKANGGPLLQGFPPRPSAMGHPPGAARQGLPTSHPRDRLLGGLDVGLRSADLDVCLDARMFRRV